MPTQYNMRQKQVKLDIYQFVATNIAQKMNFSIKDFFNKCDQMRRFLRIWSYMLKKFLMENFLFCVV